MVGTRSSGISSSRDACAEVIFCDGSAFARRRLPRGWCPVRGSGSSTLCGFSAKRHCPGILLCCGYLDFLRASFMHAGQSKYIGFTSKYLHVSGSLVCRGLCCHIPIAHAGHPAPCRGGMSRCTFHLWT